MEYLPVQHETTLGLSGSGFNGRTGHGLSWDRRDPLPKLLDSATHKALHLVNLFRLRENTNWIQQVEK